MKLHFYKYQGTGNDFILLDNRKEQYSALTKTQIAFLCNRHFGIGADGLMLLGTEEGWDFTMTYFNSDGAESSMCGNGGRCITAFAAQLGLIQQTARFKAIDGAHEAIVNEEGEIELHMQDVHTIKHFETYSLLDTGSPHYIHQIDEVKDLDVKREGALIRYSPVFKDQGVNVNFVEVQQHDTIFVRTYERGVEDETLSCGTGVTAAALNHIRENFGQQQVNIQTLGGNLVVRCNNINGQEFKDIWLCGPAMKVFEGEIVL